MDKSRVEPTIFFIEKILFSLKLFYCHFYGQSFIKTVRGPLVELSDLIGFGYDLSDTLDGLKCWRMGYIYNILW